MLNLLHIIPEGGVASQVSQLNIPKAKAFEEHIRLPIYALPCLNNHPARLL